MRIVMLVLLSGCPGPKFTQEGTPVEQNSKVCHEDDLEVGVRCYHKCNWTTQSGISCVVLPAVLDAGTP